MNNESNLHQMNAFQLMECDERLRRVFDGFDGSVGAAQDAGRDGETADGGAARGGAGRLRRRHPGRLPRDIAAQHAHRPRRMHQRL